MTIRFGVNDSKYINKMASLMMLSLNEAEIADIRFKTKRMRTIGNFRYEYEIGRKKLITNSKIFQVMNYYLEKEIDSPNIRAELHSELISSFDFLWETPTRKFLENWISRVMMVKKVF